MLEINFVCRMTGYDSKDSTVNVSKKDKGTAPNINIHISGPYAGHLEIDERCAKKLIDTLKYILGEEK